ncbi:hypothetical protein H9P43_005450 [Blastocladiella emersonii ATCC 22665]|nr:hypothetical protein H9P43_005450 [Blastocladiella emersonii ATCC 22665]
MYQHAAAGIAPSPAALHAAAAGSDGEYSDTGLPLSTSHGSVSWLDSAATASASGYGAPLAAASGYGAPLAMPQPEPPLLAMPEPINPRLHHPHHHVDTGGGGVPLLPAYPGDARFSYVPTPPLPPRHASVMSAAGGASGAPRVVTYAEPVASAAHNVYVMERVAEPPAPMAAVGVVNPPSPPQPVVLVPLGPPGGGSMPRASAPPLPPAPSVPAPLARGTGSDSKLLDDSDDTEDSLSMRPSVRPGVWRTVPFLIKLVILVCSLIGVILARVAIPDVLRATARGGRKLPNAPPPAEAELDESRAPFLLAYQWLMVGSLGYSLAFLGLYSGCFYSRRARKVSASAMRQRWKLRVRRMFLVPLEIALVLVWLILALVMAFVPDAYAMYVAACDGRATTASPSAHDEDAVRRVGVTCGQATWILAMAGCVGAAWAGSLGQLAWSVCKNQRKIARLEKVGLNPVPTVAAGQAAQQPLATAASVPPIDPTTMKPMNASTSDLALARDMHGLPPRFTDLPLSWWAVFRDQARVHRSWTRGDFTVTQLDFAAPSDPTDKTESFSSVIFDKDYMVALASRRREDPHGPETSGQHAFDRYDCAHVFALPSLEPVATVRFEGLKQTGLPPGNRFTLFPLLVDSPRSRILITASGFRSLGMPWTLAWWY